MKKLSTFLIVFPILSTLLIYLPIFKVELGYRFQDQTKTIVPKSSDYGIVIPKLGVNEAIIRDVDPFNKDEYMQALYQGVAHAKNTVTPNLEGTTYLFAHSSDNPFSITRYNTSFFLLPKLTPGDEIVIYFETTPFHYRVTKKEVVKPTQVAALTESTKNQLILQTCTPIGTSLKRLLIFAEPL